MKQREIANQLVGEIGLGCMGMSFAYTGGTESESLDVLRKSLDLGCDFWDTADMYAAGKNELLLAQILKDRRDDVFLATKFANVYDRSLTSHQDLVAADIRMIVDGTPEYVQKCCDLSLQRLGIDHIDLYYQHRVDPRVPIEETIGAMADLVKQGKVGHLGISEVRGDTIRRAHAVHPITAVQNEYSLWTRDFEADAIPVTQELGIAFVAYSPLGRGFLTGEIKSLDDLEPDDWRRNSPRFQGDNFQTNFDIVRTVEGVASRLRAKPAQIALAWVLAQGDHIIPIPGTKRLKYLAENAAASEIELSPEDLEELANAAAPAGDRYPPAGMAFIAG